MTEPSRQIDIAPIFATVLELVGVAAIVGGCFLISPIVGLIVGGLGLIFVGLCLDPPRREPETPEVKE